MASVPKPQLGDVVVYCREDYVGKVDEYPAIIRAVYDDLSCDLLVSYVNGPVNMDGIRYDPDGLPSSWHPEGK